MSGAPPKPWTDDRIAGWIGVLLRVGVGIAATVVLVGGGLYLARHGLDTPSYRVFRGEPAELRGVPSIVGSALDFSGRGTIQLGLLLLIVTPIARMAFSAVGFALQRDRTYAIVSLLVLAMLGLSLGGI